MDLTSIAPGVLAWLATSPQAGRANAGVVVDDDGLTIIDSLLTPAAARPLFEAVSALGLPIRRLVLTSSHLPQVGGSGVFALPAVYGTPQISAHLDQAPDLAGCQRMYAAVSAEAESAGFSATDIAELEDVPSRAVTHTVGEGAWLSPAVVAAPVAADLAENLVVQVPGARVVFAGAVASFGVTPMAGTGDPEAWAQSLETLLEWGDVIVPGHGAPGGAAEVQALQAYLWACGECAGDVGAMPPGPWDGWTNRGYDAINVERAAMLAGDDDSPPPSLLRLLGM